MPRCRDCTSWYVRVGCTHPELLKPHNSDPSQPRCVGLILPRYQIYRHTPCRLFQEAKAEGNGDRP